MNNKAHKIAYAFAVVAGVSFLFGIVILSKD